MNKPLSRAEVSQVTGVCIHTIKYWQGLRGRNADKPGKAGALIEGVDWFRVERVPVFTASALEKIKLLKKDKINVARHV